MTLGFVASLAVMPALDQHEFVYRASADLRAVYVAGTFNGWSANAWPMKPDADKRTWRYRADLSPGKHGYKFVLNGSDWITDPLAKKNEDDGNGNVNSILFIMPPGYEKPAAMGDGTITLSALKHVQALPFVNLDQGKITLQLRVRPGDVQKVSARAQGKDVAMKPVGGDAFYETYSATVPWDRKKPISYSFLLRDGSKVLLYGSSGSSKPFRLDPKTFKPFAVPAWTERTVLYQIFPERFENGDKGNDPPSVMPWDGKPEYFNWFGGDFAGVRKRLGYLKSLGVGAIYFNPVFQGPSNHHYETADYHRVDGRLGTNEQFAKLTRDLKAAGIKTILDGVFNHSGTDFAPFQDLLKNQQASKYKDWFFVRNWPVAVKDNPPYDAFYQFPSLPSVNLLNPDAASYMLEVPKFWDRQAEIAGWRLDTAQDAPMEYWQRFRKRVKALKPDNWILGENWGDSSPWLQGDQWDAAMNYPFRDALIHFVAQGDISASECLKRLKANYNLYVPQVSRQMMNLLSSHDTPRFLTLCGGNGKLARLGAAIQFGWPGMPSIYYGEELGMEGGRDPDNRRGMVWSLLKPENPFLNTYRKLVLARNGSRALQSGEPVPLVASDQDQTLAFARVLNADVAVVAANRSKRQVQLTIDFTNRVALSPALRKRGFQDMLGGARLPVSAKGSLTVRLEPESAALLVPASPSSAALRKRRPVPHSVVSRYRMLSTAQILEAQ